MASVRQYDSADSNQDEDGNNRDKSHRDQDPVVDLFPDDDQEERGNDFTSKSHLFPFGFSICFFST